MRSVASEDTKVGLLLFDEPSASLDPIAEHGECTCTTLTTHTLTQKCRPFHELRGNKIMLFSSHRFGNLTRHADLIL